MHYDLHKTFGEIVQGDASALYKQIVEVQQHPASREEALQWFQRIRLLDISDLPLLGPISTRLRDSIGRHKSEVYPVKPHETIKCITIPVIDDVIRQNYVPPYLAVSWPWKPREKGKDTRPGCCTEKYFKYFIRRPDGDVHESSFPHDYMDRVIRFAQHRGLTKIWIDKECIYQRDSDAERYPRDVELGTQVMDLVYKRAQEAAGLMTTCLVSQDEVDILTMLLDNEFVQLRSEAPMAVSSRFTFTTIQLFIRRLSRDPRWDRAWIFQEDHLASDRMSLLMPCSRSTVKDDDDDNDIVGEFHIPLARFKACATTFCMAYKPRGWLSRQILGKVKRYKVYNGTMNQSERTITFSVLLDICKRKAEYEYDKIPILANALRFSERLDVSKSSPLVTEDRYSLSFILLTSILMNGEILYDFQQEDRSFNIMNHTLESYLQKCELSLGSPERGNFQLFLDQCKLGTKSITEKGKEAKGWMFKISREPLEDRDHFRLTKYELDWLRDLARGKFYGSTECDLFTEVDHEVVKIITEKMKEQWHSCRLGERMLRELDEQSDVAPGSARNVFVKMMHTIVDALMEGHTVVGARLLWQREDAPPSALFIEPDGCDWFSGPECRNSANTLVFVSWRNGLANQTEHIASLEVAAYDESGRRIGNLQSKSPCALKTRRWLDGVWDVRGAATGSFVFPLPGTPIEERYSRKKPKRTRDEAFRYDGNDKQQCKPQAMRKRRTRQSFHETYWHRLLTK